MGPSLGMVNGCAEEERGTNTATQVVHNADWIQYMDQVTMNGTAFTPNTPPKACKGKAKIFCYVEETSIDFWATSGAY